MLSSETHTLEHLSHELAQGRTTSVELVEQALGRIANPSGQGATVFTRVFAQEALAQARESDQRRAAGQTKSVIDGLPISVKDLFDLQGQTTRAGSVVLRDNPPASKDALIVQRLRDAGAVIVGTTNMTEFAYSGLGLNPHYGTPLSPWDRTTGRIAGGSSSGAAASVADGMAVGAIGTDTGGSVRIPAAFCGLVGYKPTASLISMQGTLPLALHLDSIGPLANSLTSCIWLANVMADQPLGSIDTKPPNGLCLAIPKQLALDSVEPEVAKAFEAACEALRQAGAQITDLDLPELLEIATINAAGGFTAAEAYAWHKALLASSQDQYDPRVAVRIQRGANLGSDYIEQLQAQRADWIARVKAKVASYDALLMPTVPIVAPALAPLQTDDDLYAKLNVLSLRNPTVINFFDGCAVSLPCHHPGQAPVGLMLARACGEDRALLELALGCEKVINAAR